MPARPSRTSAASATRAAAAQQPQPSAPVVSQRLCDLLLSFPAAAIGGVQWQVLVRKYEERYSTRLDLRELGHTTPLAAATALLWDVVRVVDKEDTDNPIVGVEDAVALTPQPGLLGSWPSLYNVLCELVRSNGRDAEAGEAQPDSGAHCLLLSQLRPLMERHWHASFDESSLGFLNEEGSFLKLKKMKHLLNAVLRWRQQRQAWQRCQQPVFGSLDEALVPHLQVVPSTKHNDLLLICFPNSEVASTMAASPLAAMTPTKSSIALSQEAAASFHSVEAPVAVPMDCASQASSCSGGKSDVSSLRMELERLRSENQELRMRNHLLELPGPPQQTPAVMRLADAAWEPPAELPADVFDDFSEPPPEARTWRFESLDAQQKPSSDHGDIGSECSFEMGSTVSYASEFFGASSGSVSCMTSGAATPAVSGMPQHGCAFVPVWFQVMQSQAQPPWSVIPRGIVKTAREHFERIAGNQLL